MDVSSIFYTLLTLQVHWGRALTSDSQHYCYTELVTALALSCDKIYTVDPSTTTSRRRRSTDNDTQRRRIPRNVVEQCCRRPCNIATLQRYCSIVRETRRLSTGTNSSTNGTSGPTTVPPSNGTRRATGQRSTTPVSDAHVSSLQSLTESPSPEPVPVGDFNFYP